MDISAYPDAINGLSAADLGFEFFQPTVDAETGFVIGATNPSSLIESHSSLNGQPMDMVEARMRPRESANYRFDLENYDESSGQFYEGSNAGFLGETERLLDIMIADNRRVVEEFGWTHQQLSRPLLLLGYYATQRPRDRPILIKYGPYRFEVK